MEVVGDGRGISTLIVVYRGEYVGDVYYFDIFMSAHIKANAQIKDVINRLSIKQEN